MEGMYAGPLRQARALTLSGACVALSLLAHLAGGGWTTGVLTPASVCGLLALTTVTTLAVGAASGRRWSFGRAVLALAASQAGLHTAFAAKSELTTQHILDALEASPPLSVTMREKIEWLRDWSHGRCVRAD